MTSTAVALKCAAEALLSCASSQLGALGTPSVANAIRLMAAAKVSEQTFLDVLLAQLLVLLRHDRANFSPSMLAGLAGSLGALHEAGTSAKRAASGPSSTANKRCVDA